MIWLKKLISLVLAVLMLFTVSGSLAETAAENAAAPKIAGRIEDGAYVLTVPVGPEETGEWRVDEMAQDDSVVALASVGMEGGVFTACYKPTGDGEVTVHLRHYTEHRVCDQVHSFDLLVKDGKVQEVTGGAFTASPAEEDLNPYFSGEWLEQETQFTTLDVTKAISGGWQVEISSPVSHGAWLIRGTAFYDCDYDAFIYADGAKYDLTPEGTVSETPAATDLWGSLKLGGADEAHLTLTWDGLESSDGKEVTFDRAPALPAYVYSGSDELEGAVANALAASGLAEKFLSEPGYVMIPAVYQHKTEKTDDAHAKVYGTFWIMNYVKRGTVLHCISGGEYPGILTLEKDGQGWKMTNLEEAGSGDDYAEDLKRFAGGDEALLEKYQEASDLMAPAQAEIRTRLIREYVESNGLNISAYQDYGWEPVPLN